MGILSVSLRLEKWGLSLEVKLLDIPL